MTYLASEEDLYAYISDCLDGYAEHSSFGGVVLKDEPSYTTFQSAAYVYKEIERYGKEKGKEIFIMQNLLPLASNVLNHYAEGATKETIEDDYRKYLSAWQTATGADYIQFDVYPFRMMADGVTPIVDDYYLSGLKIAAELCDERDLTFTVVVQTTAILKATDGTTKMRYVSAEDLYLQTNLLWAFGADRVAYFTYFPKSANELESFPADSSIVQADGTQNDLYDTVKQIHEEIKTLAKAILNFEYKASAYYTGENASVGEYLSRLNSDTLQSVESVSVSTQGAVLVAELYDVNRANYMVGVVNVADPAQRSGEISVSVTFDSLYTAAIVYVNGVATHVTLDNHSYTFTLAAGDAVYVVPYIL